MGSIVDFGYRAPTEIDYTAHAAGAGSLGGAGRSRGRPAAVRGRDARIRMATARGGAQVRSSSYICPRRPERSRQAELTTYDYRFGAVRARAHCVKLYAG